MTEEPRTITIQSDVLSDGRYGIVISEGMDIVRAMSAQSAYKHAQEVLKAAQRAKYDAAIFLQLTHKFSLPPVDAGHIVADIRKKRRPLDEKALSPIGLEPGATIEGKPFLIVSVRGEAVGQWTPRDARGHALVALELAEVVSLDTAYYNYLRNDQANHLRSDWGLDETTARSIVGDIMNYRYRGE